MTIPTSRQGTGTGARTRGGGDARRLLGILAAGLIALPLLAFIGGLFLFAGSLEKFDAPTRFERADAIVVLTGGAARISDAVELLERGRAERLLITGVHPDNTATTLSRFAPGREELFACCVDLGYTALNTVGNAVEARDWARSRGYRSLIVVTSSYHLPRSLKELRRKMPEAVLIPHAVVVDHVAVDRWWRDQQTARLLVSEYVKYLLSHLRLRWRPATSVDEGITTAILGD